MYGIDQQVDLSGLQKEDALLQCILSVILSSKTILRSSITSFRVIEHHLA